MFIFTHKNSKQNLFISKSFIMFIFWCQKFLVANSHIFIQWPNKNSSAQKIISSNKIRFIPDFVWTSSCFHLPYEVFKGHIFFRKHEQALYILELIIHLLFIYYPNYRFINKMLSHWITALLTQFCLPRNINLLCPILNGKLSSSLYIFTTTNFVMHYLTGWNIIHGLVYYSTEPNSLSLKHDANYLTGLPQSVQTGIKLFYHSFKLWLLPVLF